MRDQARNLRIAVSNKNRAAEQRKQYLIRQLSVMDYFQTPDKKELSDLELHELEAIHTNEKCRIGREMAQNG